MLIGKSAKEENSALAFFIEVAISTNFSSVLL